MFCMYELFVMLCVLHWGFVVIQGPSTNCCGYSFMLARSVQQFVMADQAPPLVALPLDSRDLLLHGALLLGRRPAGTDTALVEERVCLLCS